MVGAMTVDTPTFRDEYLAGMRASWPFAVGAGVFGATLGLSAANAGITAAEIATMSAIVFAGASQLVAVGMIDSGAPFAAIVAAVFAVNARHLLMGAAIAPQLKNDRPLAKWTSLLVMVDETWALSIARQRTQPTAAAFLLGAGTLLWLFWMAATVGGNVFGGLLPDPEVLALDFLGVAVFVGLLIIIGPTKNDIAPFAVAAVASPLLAWVLPGSWNIIAAACLGAAIAALRVRRI